MGGAERKKKFIFLSAAYQSINLSVYLPIHQPIILFSSVFYHP